MSSTQAKMIPPRLELPQVSNAINQETLPEVEDILADDEERTSTRVIADKIRTTQLKGSHILNSTDRVAALGSPTYMPSGRSVTA